ncbi:MAG: DUF3298 domain-containing protein [Muribaculaceae bacterium]|nr:DUF3298 domain-containing protein [Muribaculaceae bacterium]
MKNKTHILSAGLCLAIMSFNCGCASNDNEQRLTVFETYTKSKVYEMTDSGHNLGAQTDITVCDSLALIMPVTLYGRQADMLVDSILSRALDIKGKSVNEAVESWVSPVVTETELPVKEVQLSPLMAEGFQIVNGTIVNFTPQLLVYCIGTSTYYPGAANGLETLDYINYSLTDNKILSLSDLFTENGLSELPKLIAEQASTMPAYKDEVDITQLPANDNFFLSSEGEIVFCYQPMEVGPHSLGSVMVAFYPYELVSYLTPYAINFFDLHDISD